MFISKHSKAIKNSQILSCSA